MSEEPRAVLAPWPQIDRFPVILGSNISFSYIAAVCRIALNGYRQPFVDVLAELLEAEAHGFSVLAKRILGVAGGRLEFAPADVPDGTAEEKRARDICTFVERQFNAIPRRTQTFASLLWGLYYGISAAENIWERTAGEWRVSALRFIHSRRLSFPNYATWDLYVWDQGAVTGLDPAPTQGTVGLRIADYPGKFTVHAPQVRADYPTREGLGRSLVYYFAIKLLFLRVSAQDFERFVKPWAVAYFATTDEKTGKPRSANDDDIAAADRAVRALGVGSLSAVVLPDSVRIEILNAASKLSQDQFLAYLDAAISKAVVGQTFTTEAGNYGSRSTAEVGKGDALELGRYDAVCFSDTLREHLVLPLVRLNFPGQESLCPRLRLHVEERPNPEAVMNVAAKAASVGMPVDADELARQVGLPLVDPTNEKARRLLPLKPSDPSVLDPGLLPSTQPEESPPADEEDVEMDPTELPDEAAE